MIGQVNLSGRKDTSWYCVWFDYQEKDKILNVFWLEHKLLSALDRGSFLFNWDRTELSWLGSDSLDDFLYLQFPAASVGQVIFTYLHLFTYLVTDHSS